MVMTDAEVAAACSVFYGDRGQALADLRAAHEEAEREVLQLGRNRSVSGFIDHGRADARAEALAFAVARLSGSTTADVRAETITRIEGVRRTNLEWLTRIRSMFPGHPAAWSVEAGVILMAGCRECRWPLFQIIGAEQLVCGCSGVVVDTDHPSRTHTLDNGATVVQYLEPIHSIDGHRISSAFYEGLQRVAHLAEQLPAGEYGPWDWLATLSRVYLGV